MNAITDNRRNTWQELIDSTNMTHSSRIAWKTIEMLGNDYTITHLRYEVTAGQVAHQLLVNSQGHPWPRPNRDCQSLLKMTRQILTSLDLDVPT